MNSLLISATHNYFLPTIKMYIDSVDLCGFNGDKIMIVYGDNHDSVEYLKSKGWVVYFREVKTKVHMDRFFDIYSILEETEKEYKYVITTDCRDVIFQTNPIDYLEKNLKTKLLISGENYLYKDETWNSENMMEGYNKPILLKKHLNSLVCNVGVIAGHKKEIKDLSLLIYLISMSGNVKYCTDQSSFNIIVHNELIKNIIQITTNETNWALQVASLPFDYEITIKNKMVMNDKHPFVIVHQYHRSKPLTDFFENVFFKKNLI